MYAGQHVGTRQSLDRYPYNSGPNPEREAQRNVEALPLGRNWIALPSFPSLVYFMHKGAYPSGLLHCLCPKGYMKARRATSAQRSREKPRASEGTARIAEAF
jgi:hypothetical protein